MLPGTAFAAWGENWGEMVWGLPVSVPSMPAVGLFVLALALFATAAWRLRARKALHSALAILVVPMLAGVLSSPAHAQVSVPHEFTNGDIADADQINANFDALEGAFNGLNCATASDVVCNPSCPACDTLGSYNLGYVDGGNDVDITSDNEQVCTTAGGTYDALTKICSVDITTDNAAAASAACTQAGGTWDAGTSTCAAAYNCYIGGFCSLLAIYFPPPSGSNYSYTNVYDGHTQGTGPATACANNSNPNFPARLWSNGQQRVSNDVTWVDGVPTNWSGLVWLTLAASEPVCE